MGTGATIISNARLYFTTSIYLDEVRVIFKYIIICFFIYFHFLVYMYSYSLKNIF